MPSSQANVPVGVSKSMDGRMNSYKNHSRNTDDIRRRRIETSVQLRKASQNDQLSKKRNMSKILDTDSPLKETSSNSQLTIQEIVDGINSDDKDRQYECTQAARKRLSKEKHPPIDTLINNTGIVPKLVQFLTYNGNPDLQFEAAWALTNIASGTSEQTMTVIKAGAVPHFIKLLASPYDQVVEQSVWALGNIAGDCSTARNLVLSCGALPPLLGLIKNDTNVSILRNIVWCVSNLCRNKDPPPNFELIKQCIPYLCNLLHYNDDDVLADTCWSMSYLTDGTNEKIQAIVDAGVVERLVELLSSRQVSILTPALRTVGNIVTGNDTQTDAVINGGVLAHLGNLLMHNKPNIVKEAAWTISNITAGNHVQIQQVIDSGLVPPLLNVLNKGDVRSQKEAAWAITNLANGGLINQLSYLIRVGGIPTMCDILTSKDARIVTVVLDGINTILQMAETIGEVDKVGLIIEECGGLDKIEMLQNHEEKTIYKKVCDIIDNFFSEKEEDQLASNESEFCPPSTPDGGYSF